MKKWIPWIVVAVFAAWFLGSLRPPKESTWAVREFGRLPIMANGRIQPLDSLARNSLLQLRDKQTANLEPWKGELGKPKIIPATEWLMAMLMNPELANTWPVIRIDNPDLKGLLGLPPEKDEAKQTDGKHYAWNQIKDQLEPLQKEARRAGKLDASQQNSFDQAVVRLWSGVGLYMRLQNTLQPQNAKDWPKELQEYLQGIEPGVAAVRAQQAGQPFDGNAYTNLLRDAARFDAMAGIDPPVLLVPPAKPAEARNDWKQIGTALLTVARGMPVPPAVVTYAALAGAYRADNPAEFNRLLAAYRGSLAGPFDRELAKASREQFFLNHLEPFYKAMILFVVAFLFGAAFWFAPERLDWARRTAVGLVLLALVIHTFGLVMRIVLEGRPPVTNLYSSAVFIGWGACILGLILEAIWRNSIGIVVSCTIGFLTLIIAHHLSLSADTMQMMEAVLDTNFWLSTHVVAVTLGYASTFVSGFLAMLYVILGVFTPRLAENPRPGVPSGATMAKALAKMVYAIICFATLFSFVGTVLGGIWADQSWGRFWGWDPKENGALIIVLWNALILHARWGGLVRERGLMNLALVGNIVTSWSWFGVNMLGIGLHSYGFLASTFWALMIWIGFNLALIGIGCLPLSLWRSFHPKPVPPALRKAEVAA